jgi:CIC family chloride channel protein
LPHRLLQRLQLRLSSGNAVLPMAALGLLSGLLAGAVILVFRLGVELTQAAFLPDGTPEGYEALAWPLRLALPVAGAVLVGALFHWLGRNAPVGVVHVMERLAYHQGHMPLRNALLQFLGAALCLVSGQSLGREGPGVHLGAGSASQLGQRLTLPNNSIRTLVACGTAASIAASFNTPLAGVAFAMEVVMMEYTIAGFTPVILASVSGAVLTRAVYGPEPAFAVPALHLASGWEMAYLVPMAIVIGLLAAAFIAAVRQMALTTAGHPVWLRFAVAGVLTGLIALAVPEVMGVGYDTVEAALNGRLGLGLLLAVVAAKLVATAVAVGLGMPGGLIGPAFIMGAAAGGAVGYLGGVLVDTGASPPAFYAMLGMGAMMGAVLQAPLAALTAMLELTANPNIILPGMLVVVGAKLVVGQGFRQSSIFLVLLRARGLDYRHDPVMQTLRRAAVASVMDTRFVRAERCLERAAAGSLLAGEPRWVVVQEEGRPRALLPAADLARFLSEAEDDPVDLLDMPGSRLELAPIPFQATLQEAVDLLETGQAEALYVQRVTAPLIAPIQGVLTRADIEASYRY